MYDFFRGQVVTIDTAGFLTLDVQGVGYHLRVSEHTRQTLPLDGSTTTVFARLVVRDDDLILFGFGDPAERAAFDLLTSVQGVGPALAMAVLSALPVSLLRQVLLRRDVTALKKIKGVGAKTAERLALELADKIDRIPAPREELPSSDVGPSVQSDAARQALVALGYQQREAIDALRQVPDPQAPTAELLRQALVHLRSQKRP